MIKQLLVFLKGILAGLAIGVGGFLYVLMTFLVEGELGKVLGSLVFAIGLFTVCTFSLMLYTGKIGMVFEKKQETSFYISLPVMLLGNTIGAFGLGALCYLIFKNNTNEFYQAALNTANSRLSFNNFNDFLMCCVRSFLCGVCVYLAVKSFALDRLKPLGISLLVFFVFLFVYCGFQHCIANMFYFGFAGTYQKEVWLDLALVILFNSFGPIVGVYLFKLFKK
ncbi:MAG: formate/nitrite transporter family protein [Bacilli bacterium]|nr:formate/nitrite transporter family protein [Bacilli bacterium]